MKIAFVVPRYGEDVLGGAETLCKQVAEHLSKYPNIDIDIITTCAKNYVTWNNEFEEGTSYINGVAVKRFKNDYSRSEEFHTLYTKILGTSPDKFESKFSEIILNIHRTSEDEQIKWMELQGPYSTQLFDFIRANTEIYDYFVFFTCLYCTTVFGLPLVRDKAILVPTAHDEPPIYLNIFDKIFVSPKAISYNTEEERLFVNKRFNNNHILNDVIGVGFEAPKQVSPNEFRDKYKISNKFLTYIGRIDESKGCGELFDYFMQYKEERRSDLKLILLGKSAMEIPEDEDIIPLGFVSEEDKFNGIAASDLMIMPSKYESFSMVIMEAWGCKRAVLVNGRCDVLKGHCLRSNGGLWYESYEEFKECLDLLISDDRLRAKMGENGKQYVEENYSWPKIEEKYLRLLDTLNSHRD